MKFFPLIWAGLWRRPTRTVLTVLSIMVAFLLFGSLHGVMSGFSVALDKMSDVRLRVISRANMIEPLPVAYRERIARVAGVDRVSQFSLMLGYYQEQTNMVPVPGLDFAGMRDIFPEFSVSDEQFAAIQQTRDGALVGAVLARQYGWKLGDRIPIHSSIPKRDGSEVWTFEIVGIVNGEPGDDETFARELWANYDYIDQARATGEGFANQFVVSISDATQAARIGADIDALFANSPYETRTMSEKDYVVNQVKQVGDIGTFVNALLGAVLFTLLFLTGNTMMQSVRDRIPEMGVLKAVGFSDAAIVMAVAAEAVLLCVFAAALGLALAALLFPAIFGSLGFPLTTLPADVIGIGLGVAVLLALIISVWPATRIYRLTIVDALADR